MTKKAKKKKERGVKTVELSIELHNWLKSEAAKKGISLMEYSENIVRREMKKKGQ